MKNYHNYKSDDVTCVICAYKECAYLEESIKCLINQTVKLFQETNFRYNEEKEIFERFWPKPIVMLLMSKYKEAEKYY